MLLAYSCRSRYFCPSCHAKRVALFASRLESKVLAGVPHRQYVFTIPKLLRLHFRFDRRLLGLLSACAYQSVLEMMRAVVCEPRAVPGMVASIQTYGDQGANWHPMSTPSSAMALLCPSVRLDPLESLAALTDHIPDKGQHLVRFYGWYSNKNRGLRKKRTSPDGAGSMDTSLGSEAFTSSGRAPADCPDDDFRKECRSTWARMIKKVFEVDPLLCPR
jgi:hypothetical protein